MLRGGFQRGSWAGCSTFTVVCLPFLGSGASSVKVCILWNADLQGEFSYDAHAGDLS